MGVGFIFPVIMAAGIMFFHESPRWDFRKGRTDRARTTIAYVYGVPENHREVVSEMREIREKFEAERAGAWYEIFTGPRMGYRTLLGMILQSLQQLTGANFFFYYGTSIFKSVGIQNSYVTAMILAGVNFGSTFPGLYVVENFGRRKSLIVGALWMFVCFMVFASMGHFLLNENKNTTTAGYVMIIFACLFITAFAMTWGPIIWVSRSVLCKGCGAGLRFVHRRLLVRYIRLGIELGPWELLRLAIGYGISSYPSSRPISRAPSTTNMVMSLRLAVSWAQSLCTSSWTRAKAGRLKRLTPCTYQAYLHGRAVVGSLQHMKIRATLGELGREQPQTQQETM